MAALLPGCADQVARYGSGHPFALDCLARHLLHAGWEAALELGHDPSQTHLTICAGIGRVTVTKQGTDFQPATRPIGETPAVPRLASDDVRAARLASCQACSAWIDGRCTGGSCGCAGLGRPELASSRCPRGLWRDLPQA